MLAAVREESGRTEVIGLVLHPDHAGMVIPERPRGSQGTLTRFDADGLDPVGDPEPWGGKRLDLAAVAPRAVTVAVREAGDAVGDPYVTVVRFAAGPRGPLVRAVSDDLAGNRVVATVSAQGRVRSVVDGP